MSWAELSGSLGVTKQAAHKRFTGLAPTLQRFTDKARQVVQSSIDRARELGHEAVGTEHLLLAMFEPADSAAALALARLGVPREAVYERVVAARPRTGATIEEAIPFSAKAKTALRAALDEALDLNHNYIGTEHLLLALGRDESAAAAQIMAELNVSRQVLREALLAEIDRIARARADRAKTAE
jgi:ATP-dependent Clp protease ATP-binding subunit ClpA